MSSAAEATPLRPVRNPRHPLHWADALPLSLTKVGLWTRAVVVLRSAGTIWSVVVWNVGLAGEGSSLDSAGGAWTVGSLWHDIAGHRLGDELLDWAPDLFAFTDVVLNRSEAYRFVVSPPEGASWPPAEMPDWYLAIADASAGWCAWVEGDGTKPPGLVAQEWAVVCE